VEVVQCSAGQSLLSLFNEKDDSIGSPSKQMTERGRPEEGIVEFLVSRRATRRNPNHEKIHVAQAFNVTVDISGIMDRITFKDLDQVRILTRSFPPGVFDTVGVRADAEELEFFGVDDAKNMTGRLTYDPKSFLDYEVEDSHLMSVDTKVLTSNLGIAASSYYSESDVSVSLLFKRNQIETLIDVQVRRKAKIRKTTGDIPTGIRKLPRLSSFEDAAIYRTPDVLLLRQVFNTFGDSEKVEVKIGKGGLSFFVPPYREENSFRVMEGKVEGEAKSTLLRSYLDYTSKVSDSSGLGRLEIRVIDDGMMRFIYEFPAGAVEYSVTRCAH